MRTYLEQIKAVQASFRGVPFATRGDDFRSGRRQAVHEYPNREDYWPEDMGKSVRRLSITGFLVGDDIIAQRERMVAAIETPGPGILIHPSLGRLTVSVLGEQPIRSGERGRVFEIQFTFVVAGDRQFPEVQAATGAASQTSAAAMFQAALGGYVTQLQLALSRGSAVAHQVVATVSGWSAQISGLANDATNLFSMLVSLPTNISGTFGRYFGGGRVGFQNINTSPQASSGATTASLIAAGAAARASVAAAATALNTAATGGDPATIGAAVQALAQALLAAIQDPRSAVRLLAGLYGYTEAPVLGSSAIPMAMLSAQAAHLSLFRRATLQALAQASAAYQPVSADDAAAVRNQVCGLIDLEITAAGDAGDDDSYTALRQLRADVAQDLATRGAGLPEIVEVDSPAPGPSLVLAQRLYRDPARADQLVVFGNPPHPAFMPTRFKALAS